MIKKPLGRPHVHAPEIYAETDLENPEELNPFLSMALFGRSKRNLPEEIINISSLKRCFKSLTVAFASLSKEPLYLQLFSHDKMESRNSEKEIVPLPSSRTGVIRFKIEPPKSYKGVRLILRIVVNGIELDSIEIEFVCPTSKARMFNDKQWFHKKCIAFFCGSLLQPQKWTYSLSSASEERYSQLESDVKNYVKCDPRKPLALNAKFEKFEQSEIVYTADNYTQQDSSVIDNPQANDSMEEPPMFPGSFDYCEPLADELCEFLKNFDCGYGYGYDYDVPHCFPFQAQASQDVPSLAEGSIDSFSDDKPNEEPNLEADAYSVSVGDETNTDCFELLSPTLDFV